MKERIFAELAKKFPGLQREFLGFLAEKLSPRVTEESQIEGVINELDERLPIKDQAEFFQKESDRRVTAAEKKFNDEQKKKKPEGDAQPTPEPDLQKQFTELSNKLAAMEKKEAAAMLQSTFLKMVASKKIPLQFAKGRIIETEDQLDRVLSETEADYNDVKQGFVNDGLGATTAPLTSSGKPDSVKEDIKEWAEANKAKA